jgi:hypothetical protein
MRAHQTSSLRRRIIERSRGERWSAGHDRVRSVSGHSGGTIDPEAKQVCALKLSFEGVKGRGVQSFPLELDRQGAEG